MFVLSRPISILPSDVPAAAPTKLVHHPFCFPDLPSLPLSRSSDLRRMFVSPSRFGTLMKEKDLCE